MKTILNHDGKALIVTSIHILPNGKLNTVYALDHEGVEKRFVNKSHSVYESSEHVAIENLESYLYFEELEQMTIDKLKNEIELQRSRSDALANEFISKFSEYDYSINEPDFIAIQKEYYAVLDRIDGLKTAIKLIVSNT